MVIYYLYKSRVGNQFPKYYNFVPEVPELFQYYFLARFQRAFKNLYLNLNAKIALYSHLQAHEQLKPCL